MTLPINLSKRWRLTISFLLLAWALGIHLAFLCGLSDPIFSPDSLSYALPALDRILGRSFILASTRTPIYSCLLYVLIKLTGGFSGVLIFQHSLTIATGVLAGWMFYKHLYPSIIGAACVFFATAALPVAAVYSHLILTETLYTILFLSTVQAFLLSLEHSTKGSWFLTGSLGSIAVLTRPVGYALLAGLGIVLLFHVAKRSIQNPKNTWTALFGAGVIFIAIAGSGLSSKGFFGTQSFGSFVLFGSTVKYMDSSRIDNPAARKVLETTLLEHRDKLDDFNWVCYDPQGPLKQLTPLYTPEDLLVHFRAWSFQALGHHPFEFVRDRLRMTGDFFWRYSDIPTIYFNRELSFFVYRGLLLMGAAEEDHPGITQFLHHSPQTARVYFDRLHQLANKPTSEAERELTQLDQHDVYSYDQVLRFWSPIKVFFPIVRWIPCFAFLASLYLWQEKRCHSLLLTFWTVMGLHAGLSTLAGVEPRYAVPIAPLYWILILGGLQTAFTRLERSKDL